MTLTPDSVAAAVRAWCEAWHSRDIRTILAMESQQVGFGFRSRGWRDRPRDTFEMRERRLQHFFEQREDYRLELEELDANVVGDVGLAWGVYVESWQIKGRSPESVRVRFSKVLVLEPEGWKIVLFHRDIQPFDSQGNHVVSL